MKQLLLVLLFSTTFLSWGAEVEWVRVAKGYKRPVDVKALPIKDGKEGLFLVLEQKGRITLTDFKSVRKKVLDWSDKVTRKGNEQGFLSMTLAPDFSASGRVYFNLNNKKGETEIWRCVFNVDTFAEVKGEEELLLSFSQPYGNHNGGWAGFGPDGMLYIATGDGGSSNDPGNVAQDLSSYLGKVLRIDVSEEKGYQIPPDNPFFLDKGVKGEIFSYGLRNPWRCFWHGDSLIIADVGQNHWEELNVVPLTALKGANFGWRLQEGQVQTPHKSAGGEAPLSAVNPALVYPHDGSKDLGGFSITGGVVYNGAINSLKGRYFFADYVLPRVWSATLSQDSSLRDIISHEKTVLPNKGKLSSIASFALGHSGELYLISLGGHIYRLSELH